jgi:hypothetical protein
MVTYTGQVLNTSASNQNGAVFLKVVTFTGNVNRTFLLVGKTYTSNLTHSGVRLLRRSRGYGQTYAALLRAVVKNRTLGLIRDTFSTLFDELIDSRHKFDLLVKILEYISLEIALIAISKKAEVLVGLVRFLSLFAISYRQKGIIRPKPQRNYFNTNKIPLSTV